MADRRKVTVGMLVALCGALMPMVITALVAWQMALRETQARVETLADLLITRERRTMVQASEALQHLATMNLQVCSDAHIRLMRQMTVQMPALDEVAYVQAGHAVCSSWGREPYELEQGEPLTHAGSSVVASLSFMPVFSGRGPAMALTRGPYRALIGLNRFVDIMVEPGLQLGLATRTGRILATLGSDSEGALARLLIDQASSVSGYQWALAQTPQRLAIALAPSSGFPAYVRDNLDDLLVPLAAVGGLVFLMILTVWLRRPSAQTRLRGAIRRKELAVHYQPMFDQLSGTCVGAEALLRWPHHERAWTSPDTFIPVAESSRLIAPMTDFLLETVTRELGPLLKARPEMHISLNLYAEDVCSGRVLAVLERTLIAAGVRPRQIWLEVTERCFMDIAAARVTLKQARDRGYVVAIDDFGTGYSSLQYLQSLPIDVLKVDKSFIVPIGTGAVSSHVIYHIIEMGKSLNLTVVAEGVETETQAAYLASQGVALVQGWLYARAMPADELMALVRERGPGPKARIQSSDR